MSDTQDKPTPSLADQYAERTKAPKHSHSKRVHYGCTCKDCQCKIPPTKTIDPKWYPSHKS